MAAAVDPLKSGESAAPQAGFRAILVISPPWLRIYVVHTRGRSVAGDKIRAIGPPKSPA